METDLQLNIHSFCKLGTCRLWLWFSVDPNSGSAWSVPKWIPEDHVHGMTKDHVRFFWFTSLAACMSLMFFAGFLFSSICSRYKPTVLPQKRPSPRSFFAKLIKQTPHKEFFLIESCAEVSTLFLCLSAVSAGLVWTRLVVPWANAALRGGKIPCCGAFSCIGKRNLCLAVIPRALTATASVADQGHGHLGHRR